MFTAVAVLIIIALQLMAGGAMRGGRFSFTLYDGEIPVLQKEYPISFALKVRVAVLYKGDYLRYYQSLASKKDALYLINEELGKDAEKAAKALEYPPEAATVEWDKNKFTYHDGKDGVAINREILARDVFASFSKSFSVKLKKEALSPSPSKQELIDATAKLSSYTTYYSSSSRERKHNIALAARRINGTVIAPNDIFSFNQTVGARTKENGFLTAKIIERGKFVDGVGGGVCQASTTIYNAALLAGVKIVRAEAHSLPVSYAPLSFDAMVSSHSDLVFTNETAYNYYISAVTNNDSATFTFYGVNTFGDAKPRLKSITLRSIPSSDYEIIEDDSLVPPGSGEHIIKEPKSGYISEGYIELYLDGKLINSERIRKDRYLPQKGIKAIRKTSAA